MIGDSGGPIHQWVGDHWIQVGIVSFGKRCAEAENPGIYTRLSFYYDWIDSNTNETGPITYGLITTTAILDSTTTIAIPDSTATVTPDSTTTTAIPDSTSTTNMIEINYFFISISSFITCVYLIY